MRNVVLFVLAVFVCGSLAFASQTPIAGSTTGTFVSTGTNTWQDLSFAGGSFSGTPNGSGILNINGSPVGTLGTLTLGICSPRAGNLWTCSNSYNAEDNFDLTVTFSLPTGITGGNTETFVADFSGSVGYLFNSQTGSNIDMYFDNYTQAFTYTNAGGSGSFTLSLTGGDLEWVSGLLNPIYDYEIDPSVGTTNVTGQITNATFTPAAVPEPTSVLLLGTLFLGLAWGVRKKLA